MTPRDDVRGLVAGAIGLRDLRALEERVASLEVAVAENGDLAVGLAQVLERLERAVVEVVSAGAAREVGP